MYAKNTTQRIVMAAMLVALTTVATMIIKIPSPLKGYINIGDCVVLLAGWSLSPLYGFLAAGIGSALADLFSGYIVYAPATFLIKGLMALIVCFGVRLFPKKKRGVLARIVCAVFAEIVMIAGYFLFEGFLYGFEASLVNIPANAIQGAVGILLGVLLTAALERSKIKFQ